MYVYINTSLYSLNNRFAEAFSNISLNMYKAPYYDANKMKHTINNQRIYLLHRHLLHVIPSLFQLFPTSRTTLFFL